MVKAQYRVHLLAWGIPSFTRPTLVACYVGVPSAVTNTQVKGRPANSRVGRREGVSLGAPITLPIFPSYCDVSQACRYYVFNILLLLMRISAESFCAISRETVEGSFSLFRSSPLC